MAGFTSAQVTRGLFGFAHGLQYFDATFFGAQQVVQLEANATYPGV